MILIICGIFIVEKAKLFSEKYLELMCSKQSMVGLIAFVVVDF